VVWLKGHDLRRVRDNIWVAGLSQGALLGASFAAAAALRARLGPAGQIFTGFLPSLSGLASGPFEHQLRERSGAQVTYPIQGRLSHDAIPGAVLLIVNLAWYHCPHAPRPLPSTPAGAVVSIGLATTGAAIAGGLSEWTAQSERARAARSGEPEAPSTVAPTPLSKGVGRAIALLPMALWTQVLVCLPLAGRRLPPWSGLVGTGVVAGGWTLRRLATPLPPPAGDRKAPETLG
jgi:hypothetical protein